MPKVVAIIGGKHSGKTTVIEHLIRELKHRNYSVGVVKEMVRTSTVDGPATETSRYADAGAEVIVAAPRNETVIFIKKRLQLAEILQNLEGLDYILLEGFESEKKLPKIIAAKTADEAKGYIADSSIAISGLVVESQFESKKAESFGIPVFDCLKDSGRIVDLLEL